jgi:tetratricopeptide (TPR) repeat protein
LKSSVVRLKRQGSYQEALDAFQSGNASLCAELLEYSRAPKAILLRVRALRRLVKLDEAYDVAVALSELDLRPFDEAQCAILRFAILHELGKQDEAAAVMREALDLCRAIPNTTLECELLFYSYVIDKEIPNVESVFTDLVATVDDDSLSASSYPYSKKYWLSRFYSMLAHDKSVHGDRHRELERMKTALALLDDAGTKDDWTEVVYLNNISDIGVTLGADAVLDLVGSRLEKFSPGRDYANFLCRTYLNLAQAVSNDGNFIEALRLLRLADEVSSDTLTRVSVMIARGDLLRDSGELLSSREVFEKAAELALTFSWDSLPIAQMIRRMFDKLLILASRLASFDVELSKRLVSYYRESLVQAPSRFVVFASDMSAADEAEAMGHIALAEDDRDGASEAFQKSLDLYAAHGEVQLASASAFMLADITFEYPYLEMAEVWTQKHPRSSLAKKVADLRIEREHYDKCKAQFAGAEYSKAIAEFRHYSRVHFRLLVAKSHQQMGQIDASIRILDSLTTLPLRHEERIQVLVEKVVIGNYLGKVDFKLAHEVISEVVDECTSTITLAQLYVLRAFQAVVSRDTESLTSAIDAVKALTDQPGDKDRALNLFSLAFWKVRAVEFRAYYYSIQGDYISARNQLLESLQLYDAQETRYAIYEASVLGNIAGLAWALGIDSVREIVLRRLEQFRWSPDLVGLHTRVYTNLAEGALVQKDYASAKRFLKRCTADDPASRNRISVVEAYLAREAGDYATFREKLSSTLALWRTTDWTNTPPHGMFVFGLAEAISLIDVVGAREILDWVDSEATPKSLGIRDSHHIYQENMARGFVAKASGSAIEAIEHFKTAFDEVVSGDVAGHCTARVAIELAEMTSQTEYLDRCRDYAEKYPLSDVARRVTEIDVSRLLSNGTHEHDVLVAAVDLYDRGRLVACLKAIEGCNSSLALLLRARCYVRRGLPDEACRWIDTMLERDTLTIAERGHALVLKVSVSYQLESAISSSARAIRARDFLVKHELVDALASLYAVEAAKALGTQDWSVAQQKIDELLDLPDSGETFEPASQRKPLSYWRSLGLDFQSLLSEHDGHDLAALEQLRRSFDEYDRCGVRDDPVEAVRISHLTNLAISLGEPSIAQLFAERYGRLEWHDELKDAHAQCFLDLAEANAIAGDNASCLKRLRESVAISDSPAIHLRILVIEAALAIEHSSDQQGAAALSEALALADQIDWVSLNPFYRRQLLYLVEQLTVSDTINASRLLHVYDQADNSYLSSGNFYITGPRFITYELYIRGRLAKAMGDIESSTRLLRESYKKSTLLFSNYERATALVALELAELTSEAQYATVAKRYAIAHPRSDVARQIDESSSPALLGSYMEALEAFQAGDTRRCVSLLEHLRAPKSILLKIRALRRIGQLDEASNLLTDLRKQNLDPIEEAQSAILRYAVQYERGNRDEAAELETLALVQCRAVGSLALEAELAFFTTILERRLDRVVYTFEDLSRRAESDDEVEASVTYPFTLKYWLARITEIAAHAQSVLGDPERELALMKTAMSLFDESGVRDDYAEIQMLANVADTGLLLGAETIADLVAPRLAKFVPNKDYDVELCRLVVTLAEVYAIDGNTVAALKLLRRLSSVPLQPDMQLRVHMARAQLLQDSGETLSAREILEQGVDLAFAGSWNGVNHERSLDAIVLLAARVASYDVDIAERLMTLHAELSTSQSTRFVLSTGRSPHADELAALGSISRARLKFDDAALYYRKSLALYETAGDLVQHARIAYELADLTFETQYLEATESWASEHPRSSLAAKVSTLRDERSRYDECVQLFHAGEFATCVDKIGTSSRTAFRLLRLEALTRLREFDTFQSEHAALSSNPLLFSDQLELRSLSLLARISSRQLKEFQEEYVEALCYCGEHADPTAKAKLLLWSALAALHQKNYPRALADLDTILRIPDESVVADGRSMYSLEYLKVRALETKAYVFIGTGKFDLATITMEEALKKYDAQSTKSAAFEGILVANLSGIAWAVGLDRVQDIVLARVQGIRWSDAMAFHETRIYTNFADVCISEGNFLGGKRFLKFCRNDDIRSKIRVLITNAYLARDNGAYQTYRSSLYEASDLFNQYNWDREGPNDYCLPLAQAVAPVNLRLAKAIVERTDRLISEGGHQLLDPHDSFRLSMAKATVSLSELDFGAAEALFQSAFLTVVDVDVAGHCTAQAAIELAELTKESRFIEFCTAYAKRHPYSESARRIVQVTSRLQALHESDSARRIETAHHLFDRGMFNKCVEGLENSNATVAILLKVRANLRLGRIAGALTDVELVLSRDLASFDRAVAMFLKYTLSMIEHGGEKLELFGSVEQYCLANRCYDALASLYLVEAGREFAVGDLALAQQKLDAVLEIPDWEGPPAPALGRSLGYYRAQATNIRFMICEQRGNYAAALEQARRYFDEYDRSGDRDDHYVALVVVNVSSLAISLGEAAVAELVTDRWNKLDLHEELQLPKARSIMFLAEANAVAGDHVSSLRHLRKLAAIPEYSEDKIRLMVTESIVHRDSGNTRLADELLGEAVEIAKTVEWAQCDSVAKSQLLILAEQLAFADPKESQRFIEIFDEVGSGAISAGGFLSRSNRTNAIEMATRGIVAKANGSFNEAKKYFKQAYDLTSMLLQNFERMTAFLALELLDITGEPEYMDVARRYIAAHPESDLMRKLPETTAAALLSKNARRDVGTSKGSSVAS